MKYFLTIVVATICTGCWDSTGADDQDSGSHLQDAASDLDADTDVDTDTDSDADTG